MIAILSENKTASSKLNLGCYRCYRPPRSPRSLFSPSCRVAFSVTSPSLLGVVELGLFHLHFGPAPFISLFAGRRRRRKVPSYIVTYISIQVRLFFAFRFWRLLRIENRHPCCTSRSFGVLCMTWRYAGVHFPSWTLFSFIFFLAGQPYRSSCSETNSSTWRASWSSAQARLEDQVSRRWLLLSVNCRPPCICTLRLASAFIWSRIRPPGHRCSYSSSDPPLSCLSITCTVWSSPPF